MPEAITGFFLCVLSVLCGRSSLVLMHRILILAGVCCLTAWMPLVSLHAQQKDVRLLDAVKRRDDKAFAALLKAKADVNASQPDGRDRAGVGGAPRRARHGRRAAESGRERQHRGRIRRDTVDARRRQRRRRAGAAAARRRRQRARGAVERRDRRDDRAPAPAASIRCGARPARRRRERLRTAAAARPR